MRRLILPLVLGLAHGVADGAAGLLLGSLPGSMPLEQVALLVLLYNGLAFGGQPVVGLLADRTARPRAATLVGLLLLAGALLAGTGQPQVAVALAGLGSAAFHVGGGALALCATKGRAAGPGLFAAPGVVGLAAGGALAAAGYSAIWPFLLPLLALAIVLSAIELPVLPYGPTTDHRPSTADLQPQSIVRHPSTSMELEGHDLVMLALLAAIALRSAAWSALQFLFEGRYELLLTMALAAAVGKILGGVLADRIGWRRWVVGALALAAPLLGFGGQHLPLLLLGVALLQSATPVGLAVAAQLLPRRPATAAGLALGLAIAIGGLPTLGGLGPAIVAPPALIGVLLAATLALWWALRAIGRLSQTQRHTARPVPRR
jgi:MFS transporter, FSR family, fosmidomycin resistance protein